MTTKSIGMGVSTQHPAYNNMVENWQKMSDTTSSHGTMLLNSYRYIPRLKGMEDDDYSAYCKRGTFVGFTQRTISAFVGMVMRKDVNVSGYIPDNFDGRGGDINSYVNEALNFFLSYGRCGTLVDMPQVEDGETISVADAKNRNITPRFLFYNHENIINWKTKLVNNVVKLSLVVLREVIENKDEVIDEFSHNEVYQYRVLDIDEDGNYRQRIFDDGNNQVGVDIYPTMGGEKMQFIPFKIHGGVAIKEPPLLGVADLNIKHFKLDVDYNHGLHFVALPTPWVTGIDPQSDKKPTTLGPTTIWYLPDESTCGYLEFTGAGLNEFRKAKEDVVNLIVILASRIIAPEKSSNDESALAASIRSNAETSTLAGITRVLSKELTELAKIAAMWENKNVDEVKIKINSDFMPSQLSGTDILSYITAWIKGGISYESMFNVLKRGEVIEGERNIEEELSAIDEEKKKRLEEEIDKASKMAEVDSKKKEEEDNSGIPSTDPERKTKLDLRIK